MTKHGNMSDVFLLTLSLLVCLGVTAPVPVAGQTASQVINVDFEEAVTPEYPCDCTYEGTGILSGTGTAWNSVFSCTDSIDLEDENENPTTVSVTFLDPTDWCEAWENPDADNELQNYEFAGSGVTISGLVPTETYTLAVYAGAYSGFCVEYDGPWPECGQCTGMPTYDLPGTAGQDFCLFTSLAPYDLGGGQYGIQITSIDGGIAGLQLQLQSSGQSCEEPYDCPIGQICSAPVDGQCIGIPTTFGSSPDPQMATFLVEGQEFPFEFSFRASGGDMQLQTGRLVLPGDSFSYTSFVPGPDPLGSAQIDLDDDGTYDVTYDLMPDPTWPDKLYLDLDMDQEYDPLFEPSIVICDCSIVANIAAPFGDGDPDTLDVPTDMRISFRLNAGIITPLTPGVHQISFSATSIDPDTGGPDDYLHNAPLKSSIGHTVVILADSDGDGIPDVDDNCPDTPNEDQLDADEDGMGDACDPCPLDPDNDIDEDGVCGNEDGCPNDPDKTDPGICGCGVAETDTDGDETPDCVDNCPDDPNKIEPGECGCGVSDEDTDGDETPDCQDNCPDDPNKTEPGVCGCGVADADTDEDGVLDCEDGCPNDPNKTEPGACGCGEADTDADGDGFPQCLDCDDSEGSVNPDAPELCNGVDDDCDDGIDEDLVGDSTSCGVGICESQGEWVCIDGAWVDNCEEGEPTEEVCDDGLDNNCDGEVDEGCGCIPGTVPGDLDDDCDVDRDDVNVVLAHRNQPASACPACDLDGDDTITVLDARKLVLMCTCSRCICDLL